MRITREALNEDDLSPTTAHHCASVKKATYKKRWLRASESGLKENRYDDEEA